MTCFKHLVEIGAGDRYSSEGLAWALKGDAELVSLYEPNPLLCADLRRATEGKSNIVVHETAVTSTFQDLICFGYASFLRGAPSFLATSVEPEGMAYWEPLAREVECVDMGRVEHEATNLAGGIDGLVLTNCGGEMDVLTHMTSRPKVIWTIHYLHCPRQWHEAQRIFDWMVNAHYQGQTIATNQHRTMLRQMWLDKSHLTRLS